MISPDPLGPEKEEYRHPFTGVMQSRSMLREFIIVCIPSFICVLGMAALLLYDYFRGNSMFNTVNGIFFLIILVLIALSARMNVLFYEHMKHSIIIPLHQLYYAAHAIQYGNFNTVVDYHSSDEIGKVCDAFRTMQVYLKESIAERSLSLTSRKIVFSGIAHDLRTPLTAIMGYTEALQLGMAKTPEKKEKYLSSISSCADNLSRLIDELSLYNKLSTSRVICHPRPVNFAGTVKSLIREDGEYLKSRNVTVTCDFDESLTVMLDQREFRRIAVNLLSNTLKYRDKDSSRIRMTIRRSGSYGEFSYHDDGPGVPADKLPHIFEAFYRTDEARSRTSSGSGLGLAIVAEIITAHRGRYRARSDGGLEIIFDIPLAKKGNDQ